MREREREKERVWKRRGRVFKERRGRVS